MSEREKGTAFEKLVAAWLEVDPVQAKRIRKVDSWSDWARRQNLDRSDTGIDLVATRHDDGLIAVQCKFFDADRTIRKDDIDSFISASGKEIFAERLIVETTSVPWSPHAKTMLGNQVIPTTAIGLRDLLDSTVDWSTFAATGEIAKPEPKALRPDQQEALEAVRAGLADADRGKLIMACGTGKTLTALRIAEDLVGSDGHVLFLMPSLALMAQAVREWCADAVVPVTAFAVCSDSQVGKRRRFTQDIAELEVTDLAFPATTNPAQLSCAVGASDSATMRIVFATYQSISVIEAAQAHYGLPEFGLIVCDEAHRTTGVTFTGEDHSNFVKVHDNGVIRGCKRLYMTATPRIYGENAKSKARDKEAVLSSMDDSALYGDLLFHNSFARAVESDILSDYRVVVLVMDEGLVSGAVQQRLTDEDSQLRLDDATKIVGCWKALSRQGLTGDVDTEAGPMRRALAFCRSIDSSKLVRNEFEQVVAEFQQDSEDEAGPDFACEVRHVDGTYNARDRGQRLDWLKEDASADTCRILSNARCLTEGVDVPALDAILFLHPRKSQIDVVQAVGRVMRKASGKRTGYVILPVGIPPGVRADLALNDNERYRVVWQILNALRAHDERLDAVINQGGLGQDVSHRITVLDGRTTYDSAELNAVTGVVDDLPSEHRPRGSGIGTGGGKSGEANDPQQPLPLEIDSFSRAVMAKIVEKCGTREYWEDWAKDVAKIAERHITRIQSLVQQPSGDAHQFFQDFLKELRDDLNESISEHEAIEMLAQHLITRPVFEALFEDHEFVDRNPISVAMTDLLGVIDESHIERETKELEGFYASVRRRAAGITDAAARQALIVELYDKFFRGAFPRTTQMLGIVYTPVEIVDFIIQSVNEALQDNFGQTLGSEGVHIIDPFVGTGTFITRLLQSGLIAPEDLERKYLEEIHANEIVLLAYYIAAINIETAFHATAERQDYLPYTGICLTDTFALHEGDDEFSFYMADNTGRRERQKSIDIRVIIGNPPYSAGQKSENDNARNVKYTHLDNKIRSTYAAQSGAGLVQNLYDSYIRAIRWGSDRLGKSGVMAYVSGSAWIERAFADGLRRCLAGEFACIYVFHLRGDVRKDILSGGRAGEGENVFAEKSMTGIAITVFVKNPDAAEQGRILYHDIGDCLDRKQKLAIIRRFGSISGMDAADGWRRIRPDQYGDWLDQRDARFDAFPTIGDKAGQGQALFSSYSLGVSTNRDAWCINPSRSTVAKGMHSLVEFYNHEEKRYSTETRTIRAAGDNVFAVDGFVVNDPKKIKWSPNLKAELRRGNQVSIQEGRIVLCMYRPFTKHWQYYSRRLNDRVGQMPSIFPISNDALPNRVIAVTGKGGRSGFSALMMDVLPNLHTIDTGQCFPFWLYEEAGLDDEEIPGLQETGYQRRDAISVYAIDLFGKTYPSEEVTREDIFHYIYGLLHSEDYRTRFAANLAKDLPRIPCVTSVEDYRALRDAGRRLGELHLHYEAVDPYPATVEIDEGGMVTDPETLYRVTKMRHPGSGKNKDLSTVIYNTHITIRDIPEEAWDYVVNGKPALQWVMERQRVKADKASGIVSDANRYAIETVGNPRYPLDLFMRVITVSTETVRITNQLPTLAISQ